MARDYFREQVASEEAADLVDRLGFTLAKSYAERNARKAETEDERGAWSMIARRIRRRGDTSTVPPFEFSDPEPEQGGESNDGA